jgi:polyphenol oxidase
MPAEPVYLRAEGLPSAVGGLMSTRQGGVSSAPFNSLNLRPPGLRGDAVDEPAAVASNQRTFTAALEGARPVWLDQVHGIEVVRLTRAHIDAAVDPLPRADASISTEPGIACTVLVADCLPVLFATADGRAVGAAHAGWRGLAAGVLEATLDALCEAAGQSPRQVSAWLGACIGPAAFEVGDDVRLAFGAGAAAFFKPGAQAGKWWADLAGLAAWRLHAAGVTQVSGGTWCTWSDPGQFFSYRRDGRTGRHAAAIWRR